MDRLDLSVLYLRGEASDLLARFSARFANARMQPAAGGAGSVVDELIAERRAERS